MKSRNSFILGAILGTAVTYVAVNWAYVKAQAEEAIRQAKNRINKEQEKLEEKIEEAIEKQNS